MNMHSAISAVPIGEIVLPVRSWNPRSLTAGEMIDYIDIGSVSQSEKAILPTQPIAAATAPSRARQLVAADDILVSTVRPNLNAVARVAEHLDGATASTGFCVLRPDPKRLDPNFLFHWVRAPTFIEEMTRSATGQSYPAVSDRIVKQSTIPLPPLAEQKRIAAILDQADALRRLRRRALDRLNTLGQAIFQEMFGDPARNPKGWRKQLLGTLASKFSDGPFGSNLKSSHYVDEGVRVIRLQNIGAGDFLDADEAFISEEHFSTLRKHECLPGDVIAGTLGDPNLRACILPPTIPRALNKADCVQIRVNRALASPAYVCSLLNAPGTLALCQDRILGQTRSRISMGRLRELQVPVPDLEHQIKFERAMDRFARVKQIQSIALETDERLFRALQAKLLATR